MIKNSTLLELLLKQDYIILEEKLKENIREEECTSKKSVGELAFVKKFIKANKDNVRKELQGILNDNGVLFVCDGYRIITLTSAFGYETVESKINIDNIMPVRNHMMEYEYDRKELMGLLRVAVTECKFSNIPFNLPNTNIYLNPVYMYEFIGLMADDAKIYIYDDGNSQSSPILLEDDSRRAMLLPVRFPSKVEDSDI